MKRSFAKKRRTKTMDDIENTINEADKCIAAWDWEISVSG